MQGSIVKRIKLKGLSCQIESHPTEMMLLKGDRLRIFPNELSESLKEGDKVIFQIINEKTKGIYAYVNKIKNDTRRKIRV